MPIFEPAGQAIAGGCTPAGSANRLTSPRAIPLPNCASVQALRLGAAAGFSPMPLGRVTSARFTFAWPIRFEGSKGTVASTVGPVGESVRAVPGSDSDPGSEGDFVATGGPDGRADRWIGVVS